MTKQETKTEVPRTKRPRKQNAIDLAEPNGKPRPEPSSPPPPPPAQIEEKKSAAEATRWMLTRISLLFRFLAGAWKFLRIPAVLGSAYIVALVLQDLSTDVVFRDPTLPTYLEDKGLKPKVLLDQALLQVPDDLEKHANELAGSSFLDVPRQFSIGQETFCASRGYNRLVSLDRAYFKNQKSLKSERDLNSQWFSLPAAEKATNWLRLNRGKPFQYVDTAFIESDGHYIVRVVISPVSGGTKNGQSKTIDIPIEKPSVESAQRLMREIVLRVAYPELASLVRNVQQQSDLTVEKFEADAYPSPDRNAMLDFALFVALQNHPDGITGDIGYKRASWIGQRAVNTSNRKLVSFNKDEMDYVILAAKREFLAPNDGPQIIPSEEFDKEMDRVVETYASKLGVPYNGLNVQSDNLSFLPAAGTLTVLKAAVLLSREIDLDTLHQMRANLDKEIKQADSLGLLDDPNAQAYIKDLTFIYAYGILQLPAERRQALEEFAVFYDNQLDALLSGNPFLSREERSSLEMIAMLTEIRLENYQDALARADHLLRFASPCTLNAAGIGITALIAKKPASIIPDEISALNVSAYRMFEKAEADGLRNFDIYNNMGWTLHRAMRPDAALANYTRALNFTGETPWAYLNKGDVYFDEGMFEEAQAQFELSIDKSVSGCLAAFDEWADVDQAYNNAARQMGKDVGYDAPDLKNLS